MNRNATATPAASKSVPAKPARDEKYPYGGRWFTSYVRDSYRGVGEEAGNADKFYSWWQSVVQTNTGLFPGDLPPTTDSADPPVPMDLPTRLTLERKRITALPDAPRRASEQVRVAQMLHKAVKTVIPKFSLERGYEFRHVVGRGERQCLLQSVLLAGMMQAMGMDAGAFMVWKSETGNESNNGHVVTVLKLADGGDVLIDCSDPHPIAKQQGLFVWDDTTKQHRFVEPEYDSDDSGVIRGYRIYNTDTILSNKQVRPLDARFVDSQFDFYRGEHVRGGLLHTPRTDEGLAREVVYLRRAVKSAPQNPLPIYMLGRVYLKQNKLGAAKVCLTRAHALYAKAGRVPQGARDALTDLRRLTTASAKRARNAG